MGAAWRAGAAILAAGLASCSGAPRGDPALVGMSPSTASGLAPTPVRIAGRGLDAEARVDLGDGRASTLETRFAATLVPWDGGSAVPLGEVVLVSPTTLTAVVPAGMSAGRHDLEVVDPRGAVLRLPDAFRVGPAVQDLAGFRIDPIAEQRAGAPFAVTISAVDALGRVIEAFRGTVALGDATGTASPATVGPFVLGTLRALVNVAAPVGVDRIVVDDGMGRSGTSNDFRVAPGQAVRVAFAAPWSASASGCSRVDLELRDAGDHATVAAQAMSVRLESAPPGALLFHADPACSAPVAELSLSAGAAGTALHVRGAAAGAAAVRLVPDALPTLERSVEVTP